MSVDDFRHMITFLLPFFRTKSYSCNDLTDSFALMQHAVPEDTVGFRTGVDTQQRKHTATFMNFLSDGNSIYRLIVVFHAPVIHFFLFNFESAAADLTDTLNISPL
jgi:hypothetical protein